MVEYLASLGNKSAIARNNSYWYRSLLHLEKTPSFVVNRNKKVWYDFGLGKGGSIIDFGNLYHKMTILDLLQLLSDDNYVPLLHPQQNLQAKKLREAGRIKIVAESKLSSPSLLNYIESRKIPVSTVDQYCREVRFEISGKNYFGISFQNDSGGFEIQNPYFKSGSSSNCLLQKDLKTKAAINCYPAIDIACPVLIFKISFFQEEVLAYKFY